MNGVFVTNPDNPNQGIHHKAEVNRNILKLFNNYEKFHDTNVIALYIENDILNLLDWKVFEIQKYTQYVPAAVNGDSIHWLINALPDQADKELMHSK